MLRDKKLNWTQEAVNSSNAIVQANKDCIKNLRKEGFSYEEIMYLYVSSIDELILRCIREEKREQ